MRLDTGGPISTAKQNLATNAAVAACDAIDGVIDGVIDRSAAVHVQPGQRPDHHEGDLHVGRQHLPDAGRSGRDPEDLGRPDERERQAALVRPGARRAR